MPGYVPTNAASSGIRLDRKVLKTIARRSNRSGVDLKGWLAEISGLALLRFHLAVLLRLAFRRYTPTMRMVTHEREFPRMSWNARIFILIYSRIAGFVAAGYQWPLWLLVLPRILGAPVMLLFTLIQHVELQEHSPSILESTRSFRTNWIGRFLYMNMNNHVEHHLYPQVPFHALPKLREAVKTQTPEPDPGFIRTNWEVFVVVVKRTLGLNTQAATIRQAPDMIAEAVSRKEEPNYAGALRRPRRAPQESPRGDRQTPREPDRNSVVDSALTPAPASMGNA